MKLSLLFASVLFLGCASTPVPPKKAEPLAAPIQRARAADCVSVYNNVVTVTLPKVLEPEQLFSKEALEEGATELDQFYTRTGRKQYFFLYCLSKLNISQTSCMSKAKSLEAMDVCERVYKK